MKKEMNILEQFDHLETIEPSAEWNQRLMQRIDKTSQLDEKPLARNIIMLAIVILLAFNVFSFTKSYLNDREVQNNIVLKNIATEYLITTNTY
jgi:hypothetical protein